MGVGSLFTYLSLIPNCATIVDLLSFGRGLTIGLDASCWLHALCHNPNVAKQLVFMNRVDALVHGFVERCQRLHEHGIILRVVFDGPAPAGKCSKSARTGRDANSKTLLRIRSQIRSGAAAESIPISDVEKAAGAALKALARSAMERSACVKRCARTAHWHLSRWRTSTVRNPCACHRTHPPMRGSTTGGSGKGERDQRSA